MTTKRVDLDTLQLLVMQEPLAVAGKEFGDAGVARMKGILRFLKQCAKHATVHEKSGVIVFALLQSDAIVDQLRAQHATAFQLGVSALGSILDLTVEIREDGSSFVWRSIPSELDPIIKTGIIYQLLQSVETFSVKGARMPVPKVIQGAISQYLLNTFTDLKEALVAYRNSMARTSKCHGLREAWAEPNRLFFQTKPEFLLRKGLANYLYAYLRHDNIDLREEQNVDDSHPVDIKVVWRMENRSAIIEVKWLGKSINITTGKVTATYSDARARHGAKQLAEYLESHRQQAASEDTRGYLVVFDCRRRRLKPSTTALRKAEGFHYNNSEISYQPEYQKIRQDFEEPIRMFLEPVCV